MADGKKAWVRGLCIQEGGASAINLFHNLVSKKKTLFHNLLALLLFGGQEWTEHFYLFILG
jgi:hypothetical protein